jgi:hypothetical protein
MAEIKKAEIKKRSLICNLMEEIYLLNNKKNQTANLDFFKERLIK